MKSIMQNEKVCYITGRTDQLHKHHIFGGANRKISDQYGFWVWLTYDFHNGNNHEAVHNNPNKGWDLKLKQACQRKYGEGFVALIGRNYLED